MNCFPEATYAIYVDDEVAADEAGRIEAHLSGCSRCQALVEALRAENRLLADVLLEVKEAPSSQPVSARATQPLDVLWTGLAVLAAAAGLQAVWTLLSGFEAPAGANWLNPFSVTSQWSLFFRTLFYFIEEGAAVLISNIVTIVVFTFVLLVLAGMAYLLRHRPAGAAVLACLTLAVAVSLPAGAVDVRSAKKKALVIEQNETLDDTLIFHGETLIVKGTVTGNVIAFAERVEINGTVQGDLISFAGMVLINGTVDGNAYTFSKATTVKGRVARSLHSFSSTTRIESPGSVAGDVFAFTSDASIDGAAGRDLYAFAGMTHVEGSVGRNIYARTGRLGVGAAANVGGDVTAYVKKQEDVQIDPGATVAGMTDVHLPTPRPSRFLRPKFYVWEAIWLAAAFVLGLLLNWLFPALFQPRLENAGALLRTLGLGFLILVATPVAAIIVAVTVVGMPLAVISLVLLLLGVYLAKIFVAAFVGRALAGGREGQPPAFALQLLLGLAILFVAMNLPYLGGWIAFLVILLGLGMAALRVYRAWQRPAAVAA